MISKIKENYLTPINDCRNFPHKGKTMQEHYERAGLGYVCLFALRARAGNLTRDSILQVGDGKIRDITLFLQKHYSESETLDTLSGLLVEFKQYRLSRVIFQKINTQNMNPYRRAYLMSIQELLKNNSKTVGELTQERDSLKLNQIGRKLFSGKVRRPVTGLQILLQDTFIHFVRERTK